jgi:glycosyltransferase involved in cell wall biosynthesis
VLTTLPQLLIYCLSRRVDLINVHYPSSGFALLVNLARWLRVPLIVSAHGSDLLPDSGPERGRGLLRLLESADAVVVPSQDYLRSVIDAFPWLVGKIQCIYNGYDEEELAAVDPMQLGQSEPHVTALCIAALIPKKGVDVLLRALNQCKSSQLRLRLIGEAPHLACRIVFHFSAPKIAMRSSLKSFDVTYS